jgi:nucleotide-binding universal stress UspA family protein
VIGTRGRGGLQHRLLGSVTDYVVTHAAVPVHVVPEPDRDE